MWNAWLLLMLNGLFFTLRLSSGSGSFPRPLKKEEEAEYLKRMAEGDPDARNALIEHNLRLVAHIIKKKYHKQLIHRAEKRRKQIIPVLSKFLKRVAYCCFFQGQSGGQVWQIQLLHEYHS